MSLYNLGAKGAGNFFCIFSNQWVCGYLLRLTPPPPIGVGQKSCVPPKSGWVPFRFEPPPSHW